MEMKNLGERIRHLRIGKGYPVEYMATKLKMSCSGYSKIERGESELTLRRLKAIAEVLGCCCTMLLEEEQAELDKISLAHLASKIDKIETALAIIVKEINTLKRQSKQN
ncbi:helix-turn-helix domain-containing protein [Thermoflexibacter ruber]|uniref:Transcriptional regulator, contains XRE-family HTH domain n=1 Tax=Thermoflexibacter ruber TaxID=1003 RepID=A0A1I2IG80_9BACT|nr:helix-turn-helix transcriptional regulator [Thermoflexibacter ruber]SFF40638.1 Transcriptional regulator, contains XRE-family HTH domain [Thermoflexibacter ruber]